MPFLKQLYFNIKYFLKKVLPSGPIILMYHRVATEKSDPHLLCVSPKNFSDHIEYLSKNRTIVSLAEIVDRNCPNDAVAITFDDGYADNLRAALPILKKFNAHATIFITAGLLGQKFPWDDDSSKGRAMVAEEVKTLLAGPLIEIGAHTLSHPKLSELTHIEQQKEIIESKNIIENIVGRKVHSFAYPFGDYNEESVGIVKNGGFKIACAVRAEQVKKDTDPFILPRYIVRDWSIQKFVRKLNTFK